MLANIANTFANCFKIPELKSRILFTLVVLAICRVTAMVPDPGPGWSRPGRLFRPDVPEEGWRGFCWACTACSPAGRWNAARWAPWHHALHQRHHHSAAFDRRGAASVQTGAGGRRAGQDHPVWTLFDRAALLGQGLFMAVGWEHASNLFPQFTGDLLTTSMRGAVWWYRIETVIILTTATLLLMWWANRSPNAGSATAFPW